MKRAITMSALFYHLLRNPEKYARLRDEVDAAMVGNKSRITFSEAQKLPYLDACIKEILRFHPAVGFNVERVVPAGGRRIQGRFVPGGTVVGMNPWTIHRNKAVFGKDADMFRPERWMEEKEVVNESRFSLA